MRILVVEDDPDLAKSISQGLQEAGMAVDTVADGNAGLTAALTVAYDVVVLDVMLPERDGFKISAGLRERRVTTPILILTGRNSIDDRVTGLEAGADEGPGVPTEQRERISDCFARADSARTRSSGGAGLGLALSAAIAAAQGGSLELVDRPAPGATFRLRLPHAD